MVPFPQQASIDILGARVCTTRGDPHSAPKQLNPGGLRHKTGMVPGRLAAPGGLKVMRGVPRANWSGSNPSHTARRCCHPRGTIFTSTMPGAYFSLVQSGLKSAGAATWVPTKTSTGPERDASPPDLEQQFPPKGILQTVTRCSRTFSGNSLHPRGSCKPDSSH